MFRKPILNLVFCGFALFTLESDSVLAAFTNGDFSEGDFTGWTFFNDPHGTANGDPNSGGNPEIATFDVTGSGESPAALFRVGRPTGAFINQGGGIFQNISTFAGDLFLSIDIAVESTGFNAQGGLFELMVNGQVVDSVGVNAVDPGEIVRDRLEGNLAVGAGAQEVRIAIRRLYGAGSANTPVQYVDNVFASGSAVTIPEPISLFFLSAIGIYYAGRRNRTGRR